MQRIITPIICFCLSLTLFGQANIIVVPTGISNDGSPPHPDAILDLNPSEKAFGLPVLTQTQRNALNPALGMCIYNIDDHKVQAFARTFEPGPNQIVYDEYNPTSGLGAVIYYNNGAWNKFDYARTFTATASGLLINLDLALKNLGGNNCEVRLYNGNSASGTPIASTTIVASPAAQWHSVTFSSAVNLVQGSEYTVAVVQECLPNMGTVLWFNALDQHSVTVLESYDNSTVSQQDLCTSENWSLSARDVPALRVQVFSTGSTFDWVNLH